VSFIDVRSQIRLHSAPSSSEQVGNTEGNVLTGIHPDFMSFVALAQLYRVNFWLVRWSPALSKLGKGATGDVRQFVLNANSQFAFKRFVSLQYARAPAHLSEPFTSVEFDGDTKLYTALIFELVLLGQSDIKAHRYIVDVKAVAFDVEERDEEFAAVWPVLVIDKAQHGSLAKYKHSRESIEFSKRLRFCARIGSAVSTMHSDIMFKMLLITYFTSESVIEASRPPYQLQAPL
jgi:hypothetical protein